MRHVKSGVRSTKEPEPETPEIREAEAHLAALRKKHRDIHVTVKDASEIIYTDQTGRFPVVSSQGHKYLMFLYEADGNYIMFEPMRSREEGEMIRTYNVLIERLKSQGIKPIKQMLDNEASQKYLKAIEEHGITWELVPPSNHRRNLAERAIQIGKSHIKSCLTGCSESFPMREWHRLLKQMEMTCNMLRPSNLVPTISAHSYLYGVHDYNRMPLAPLGCATQCFVDTDDRTSWGPNSIDSWYIGTSDKHYRCYDVFAKHTKAVRTTDTIKFMHKWITSPSVQAADVVVAAAERLTDALQNNIPDCLGESSLEELERLANIFHQAALKLSDEEATRERAADPRVAAN